MALGINSLPTESGLSNFSLCMTNLSRANVVKPRENAGNMKHRRRPVVKLDAPLDISKFEAAKIMVGAMLAASQITPINILADSLYQSYD